MNSNRRALFASLAAGLMVLTSFGCTPTVRVESPSEPITINLNVKIEHEIRVKIDKELDELFSEDSGLF
ncbi:MAG: YnbE family lipoprotein [marine bacterium B5-7]|nr:MAG: YnbE family lipoprotein [marine bacterium B5-7]